MRFDFQDVDAPSKPAPPRGAAPVGFLQELAGPELAAILYMRSWCEGGAAKERITSDFRQMLGEGDAWTAVTEFDELMRTTLGGARRPLMRHAVNCKCFGGDESAFANMVAAAAVQDTDEAMLFACNLLNANAAFQVVRMARALGPMFLRISNSVAPAGLAMDQPSPSQFRH
ncbi:hypothetical protein [Puniceibacterium sp. IMCC21224]|uniref:hypothetical protein n=1 Tax=Puniceibacterium sp. IMCC21224 TaxID=1618204 RepID=UPI00064DA617|nr:hypothetical protein [Puniceibacterium sp. IMCC21224]